MSQLCKFEDGLQNDFLYPDAALVPLQTIEKLNSTLPALAVQLNDMSRHISSDEKSRNGVFAYMPSSDMGHRHSCSKFGLVMMLHDRFEAYLADLASQRPFPQAVLSISLRFAVPMLMWETLLGDGMTRNLCIPIDALDALADSTNTPADVRETLGIYIPVTVAAGRTVANSGFWYKDDFGEGIHLTQFSAHNYRPRGLHPAEILDLAATKARRFGENPFILNTYLTGRTIYYLLDCVKLLPKPAVEQTQRKAHDSEETEDVSWEI